MDRDGRNEFSTSGIFESCLGDLFGRLNGEKERGREIRVVLGILVALYFGFGGIIVFCSDFTEGSRNGGGDGGDYFSDVVRVRGFFTVFCGDGWGGAICRSNVDCNFTA